ncbi:phosphatidate cytidylyltransferase [Orbaceae bacterium ac157xtp]
MNMILVYSLVIVFALLILASITIFILGERYPQKDWTELRLRIKTWWWIVIVFTLAITTPNLISLTIFAIISFLALKEYVSLVSIHNAIPTMLLLLAYLSIPFQYFWVYLQWYGMFSVFIPVYVFLFLPIVMIFLGRYKDFLHSTAFIHWGIMTTIYAISHVAYLMVLPTNNLSDGVLLVIFLVALTECNDIAQYLWGKFLGKIKITPKISPNKTLAGLLGGVTTTVILAWILGSVLTPLNSNQSLLAGLLIGLSGFVGDIVMSAIKRDVGVKDSGNLLPGHGGILDRLDSLIYTAPLFFHFIRYLYY